MGMRSFLLMDRAGSASGTRAEIEQEALKTSQGVPPTDATGLSASSVEIGEWGRAAVGFLVLASVLFFARLGARALWASEFRWAEIAREMIVAHNYFWPTINGRVYYDKPLGSYWLVVASTWLTGGMNEPAARIPCALAGRFAEARVAGILRRPFGLPPPGLAALIPPPNFSVVFFSRPSSA